jgi:hypothetical protein
VATTTTTVASITTLVEMGWLLTGPLGKRKLSYYKGFPNSQRRFLISVCSSMKGKG